MKSKTEKLIRRFEISLAAAFVITSIFSFVSFAASCSDVRRDVLRMHVIANSDSDEDQILKLKVRDAVLNEGKEIFDGSLTSANAEKLLIPQKERLEETAREVIRKNGFDYDVRLEIGKDFFSTRTYDDRITLPAGEYEAVRVIIGEGKGKNWCIPAAFRAFCGLSVRLWGHPRRGIDKGRNRAREYAEYPQKIKRPYKR